MGWRGSVRAAVPVVKHAIPEKGPSVLVLRSIGEGGCSAKVPGVMVRHRALVKARLANVPV
jgi:hypothetical protein